MSALDLDEEALAPWNFTWIVKRELAIMGYPKCKGNVKYLMQNNIGHLISLSPEKQPPFELFPNNFKWTPLDILEFEPPTPEQIQTFIRISRETLASHQAVGVHCRMGKGRSGVLAACYMVYFYGLTPENAITHVRLASSGSIETYAQERAVRAYHDYLRTYEVEAPKPPTEEELLQQYIDSHLPETFNPTTSFKPRHLNNPTLNKYWYHSNTCPEAKKAKRTYLPHRVSLKHDYVCDTVGIPPKKERYTYMVHLE